MIGPDHYSVATAGINLMSWKFYIEAAPKPNEAASLFRAYLLVREAVRYHSVLESVGYQSINQNARPAMPMAKQT